MKFTFLLALFSALSSSFAGVQLGIDVLQQQNFAPLRGKRVGLVTNQTGVNSAGVKTRMILRKNVNLVALYTPEHGLDGTEKAGKYVASRKDPLTGLTAWSLYGDTRKPSPRMLAGIDVLVYDMQDIGCRSYTYVSTMVKCMEAAGERGIQFVVLDRPNPIGGLRVEGPPMEAQWISFVGQLPVPYVHGMTVGELARMANSRNWIQPACKLTVVPMRGWERSMTWEETGLRWVPTSPNIPRATSPLYYVATGLVGELAGVETGCGGPTPFEILSAKGVSGERFVKQMKAQGFQGVSFTPYGKEPVGGARLCIDPNAKANLTAIGTFFLAEAHRSGNLFKRSDGEHLNLFYKCYGSDSVRRQVEKGTPAATIVAGWRQYVERFQAMRVAYLLY